MPIVTMVHRYMNFFRFVTNRCSFMAERTAPRCYLAPALICLALIIPLGFSAINERTPFHLGLPCVNSGDEPHYLVSINSLLNGHFNLAEVYAKVPEGAPTAGKYFKGHLLDHHTVWFEGDKRVKWSSVYAVEPWEWDHDATGHAVPHLRHPERPAPTPGHPEYSTHPYGLALILTPVLWPFRNTSWVEPLALLCSTLATTSGLFFLRGLAFAYTRDALTVNLLCLAVFLGTPIWCYGRSLFNEPYLMAFAIGSYSLTLRNRLPLLSGLFIGLGMLMKPTFALFLVPLWFRALWKRRLMDLVLLPLAPVVSLLVIFALDQMMFGSPFRSTQAWIAGSFWTGATGILFSWKYGYLLTTPAILLAFYCWPAFYRQHREDAIVVSSIILLHYGLFSCYDAWNGATCYGERYMVPILPLVFLSLVSLPTTRLWQCPPLRVSAVSLILFSVVINGFAAIPYWGYWDSNPILYVLQSQLHLPIQAH